MRRRARVLLGFLALAAGPGALLIGSSPASAQAGPNELTIAKVVDGTAPPGAQWVVDIDCEGADIQPSSQLTFTGPGSQTVQVFGGVTCTVVETTTAGATVTYACQVTSPDADAACISDNAVDFEGDQDAATITVTNTFAPAPALPPPTEPPVPAEPVTAAARFTG